MFNDDFLAIMPLELLELLRGYPFLEDFALALYYENDGVVTRLGEPSSMCGGLAKNLVCSEKCEQAFEKAVQSAIERKRPMLFSCRAGLMNFAVPFQPSDGFHYCFVGGGVRDRTLDLFLAEKLARADRIDGFALIEILEELPSSTPEEVKEAAKEVSRLLDGIDPDSLQSRLLERSIGKFRTCRGLFAQMDQTGCMDELKDLLSETLGVLFDVPRVAIGVKDGQGRGISLRGIIGMPERIGTLTEDRLAFLFSDGPDEPAVVPEKEVGTFFPYLVSRRALCYPIAGGDDLLGLLAFFDGELGVRDVFLVEMLTDRIAAKVVQFRSEERRRLENALSSRFVSVLSMLSQAENRRELYVSILKMAADLVDAASGSLMLVDESGAGMRIESVIGMNLQLAKSISVKVGRGIAGKVAETGQPLLVKDIEQDTRVRIRNRSRFKTKSFVSIPLAVQGVVIGVLNLSDKGGSGVFTEEDLEILLSMARHACVVLERSESSEKAAQLEESSVMDPLTGLFNRRFLEQRIEEEMSRGERQKLEFSILLVDVDNFRVYNELCGHAAGDVALKKIARILKNSARQMDIVTRYGGERFCVILPGTPKKESMSVSERFRKEVERAGFTHEENMPLGCLTVSIGVASFPENGRELRPLTGSAELALQRAKLAGRNQVMHVDAVTAAETRGGRPRRIHPERKAG